MSKWNYVKLGDVCTIERGGSPRPIEKYITQSEDGINWIKIGDTDNSKYIVSTKQKITNEGALKSRFVRKGDFLLSNSMSFGRPYILKIDGCIHDGWLVIRDNKSLFDKNYLYYYLSSPIMFNHFKSLAVGGVVNNLNSKMVRNVSVALPPIYEQKRIALTLDNISELLSHYNLLIEKINQLIKSRFVEMFGDIVINSKQWECKVFSEIASSRLGKMLDTKQRTGQEPYPYLANFNVQWFRFDFTKLNEMDFNKKDRLEFHLEDGDLLVCEGGEIGRCAIWHKEIENCYFQKALHRVRCNKNYITPVYLAWWFKFMCDGGGFSDIEGAKATISHLPGAKLKKLSVVVPPLELQIRFADFVTQVEKQKASVQKSIDKLETLKKSLMQEYFG